MAEPTHSPDPIPLTQLFADHSRYWHSNLYVYPVISRRSGGLSIGINLNPNKACNFDCIYCQVDRTIPPVVRKVDLDRLKAELDAMVRWATSGQLFESGPLTHVPASHRRLEDIAFSGDGEPTIAPEFFQAARIAVAVHQTHQLENVKLRLITDAAYLNRPGIREALAVLDACHGEIWAKLDAGTEAYYQLVNRPNVPLQTILDHIRDAARVFRVVIQSLWMTIHGQVPPDGEVDAFAQRLRDILNAGGRLQLVQIYTTARQTAEPYVAPLTDEQLAAIADRVRAAVSVPIAVFGTS